MTENESNLPEFNRRDFLKSGSVATLMTMLGGVRLMAQTNPPPAGEIKNQGPVIKIAVIGLGAWGREIVNTLVRQDQADLAAVCDTYPAFLKRGGRLAPKAAQTNDYRTLLENKDIQAIVVATPTHQHKQIALEALQAGKHVYCEAPLANTIEDARAIASAAKAVKNRVFQAGLQVRSDPERSFLLKFVRTGAIGQWVMTRAQWHKKQSWRSASPNPEREIEINWRLDKKLSLGLVGEIGIHQLDQASWFVNALPVAVTGWGAIRCWNQDGRTVPDTIQTIVEFPGKVNTIYDASLANSFDGEYEMLYGTDAAIMLRESKAWAFKEVDSPLFDWEVYARRETFYKETGIALVADATKSSPGPGQAAAPEPFTDTPLAHAFSTFLRNAGDVITAEKNAIEVLGPDDKDGIAQQIAGVKLRMAAGYVEGFQSNVIVIKANEAVMSGKRIEISPDLYELA